MFFHLYGFFIALGILVGAWISEKLRKKLLITHYSLLITSAYDLLPWVLIPGIIGARLYHVLDWWEYYSQSPLEMIMVWQGGLGIFGGIIGGGFGLFAFSYYSALRSTDPAERGWSPRALIRTTFKKFLILLDLAAIGLPVGQAIGRLGNYFNQELYGLPTNLPWGIYIRPENRLLGYGGFERFHPLFAYEGLWCLIIFLVLLVIANFSSRPSIKLRVKSQTKVCYYKKPGRLFFTYLGLYSFGRFWLEFLRIESWMVRLPFTTTSVRVAQVISLGLMIISGWFWITKKILFSEQER